MKKIFLLTSVALAALVACNKAGTEKEEIPAPQISNAPAWLYDESLPVPVMFNTGNGAETKSGLITSDIFGGADFRYGVTALDIASPDVKLFKVNGNYAVAKNVNHDNIPAGSKYAQFVDGNDENVTYYYPLQSANNFTFFGYRTNEDDDFALTWTENEAYINNIAIGHQDILWTWYEAPSLTPTPGQNVVGYNAKYIRKAWEYVNNNETTFYSTWAPKLVFNHVTSALQFVIKTDPGRLYDPNDDSTLEHKDDAAKKFEDADIYVTSLTVSGLHTQANMHVTYKPTGNTVNNPADIEYDKLLEAAGTVTDIPVQNVVNPTVSRNQQDVTLDHFYPQYNDDKGNNYGEPLLVLPTAVEGTDTPITATLVFHVPNQNPASESIEVTINRPTNGFEAGKKYEITILVHSPEEIEVVTSLLGWDDGDDVDIEIE